jgi:NADPH:quinone reductase-like Zn-dependent oxidoreductase
VIDSIFAFDDAPEAHRHMESSRHIGKLVLAWDRDLARDVPTR